MQERDLYSGHFYATNTPETQYKECVQRNNLFRYVTVTPNHPTSSSFFASTTQIPSTSTAEDAVYTSVATTTMTAPAESDYYKYDPTEGVGQNTSNVWIGTIVVVTLLTAMISSVSIIMALRYRRNYLGGSNGESIASIEVDADVTYVDLKEKDEIHGSDFSAIFKKAKVAASAVALKTHIYI